MSVKMRKHTERAQHVDMYLDAGAEDFPANSKGGALAASFKEEYVNLTSLATAKEAGKSKRQQGTAGRRNARVTLRALVEAVADTAKSIASEHPNIKGIFDLAGKDRSDQTLVATARVFADAAASLVGLFVEYGLPATFINDLRAGADSLDNYISLQEEGTGAGVNTSTSAEETYQRLADLIDRLDPIVRNKYRGDQVKINAWVHSKGNDDNTPPPPHNG